MILPFKCFVIHDELSACRTSLVSSEQPVLCIPEFDRPSGKLLACNDVLLEHELCIKQGRALGKRSTFHFQQDAPRG